MALLKALAGAKDGATHGLRAVRSCAYVSTMSLLHSRHNIEIKTRIGDGLSYTFRPIMVAQHHEACAHTQTHYYIAATADWACEAACCIVRQGRAGAQTQRQHGARQQCTCIHMSSHRRVCVHPPPHPHTH